MSNEKIAKDFLDQDGNPIGKDSVVLSGSKIADDDLAFVPAFGTGPASYSVTILQNPVAVNQSFLIQQQLTPTSGVSVGMDFVTGSPGLFDVQIGVDVNATAANLASQLNLISASTTFNLTAVAVGPVVTVTHNVNGDFPNCIAGLSETGQIGIFSGDAFNAITGGAITFWIGGGPSSIIEQKVTVQEYEIALGIEGPSPFTTSGILSGTETPEVLGTIVDPNLIIASTQFIDVPVGLVNHRAIEITPTANNTALGTATINWTWNGRPFVVQVTKALCP